MNDNAKEPTNDQDGVGFAGPKKFDPKLILRIVWSMLRRRWIVLGVATIIALATGAVGSGPLTEKVWKSTGLLLYTPPTIPEKIESIASSVSLTNVSGFANSRPVLYRIKEDLGLQLPVALLAKALKVETSRNSSTVFFALSWGDKKEANDILERVMVVYPEYVAEVRQKIAQAMLSEVEQQIINVRARESAARDRFRDFTRENNIVDFKQDLVLMQAKVLGLETKYSQAKRDVQTMGEQIEMLDKHISSIRTEADAEAEANADFEAANESLADNRRRQDRLRELIAEERRILDVKSQIEVKRREYERTKMLAEKDLTPNSKLEKVRGELESMIAKITQSDSIIKWKHEMTELDKLVVPKNKVNKKGSPIIQQILFKKLETQLGIAQQEKAQISIERELGITRSQIATFQRLRGELQTLEDDIDAIGKERLEIEAKSAMLRQLATTGAIEFSVVSPVSSGDFPISSNRKKMFIGVVLVALMLCGTSIAAFDVLLCGIIPPDVQVELMGLSILSRQSQSGNRKNKKATADDVEQKYSEAIREFALQLRQRIPRSGSLLMISGMNAPEAIPNYIRQLATCFAARDERVLILDARPPDEDGTNEFAILVEEENYVGLSNDVESSTLLGMRDWLALRCDTISAIVHPTSIAAVDYVLPGGVSDTEELATIRMSELVDYVRQRYSLTILLSPDSTHSTELQILAAHVDAIALAFDPSLHVHSATGKSVKNLFAVQAPVLGAVEVQPV